MDGDEPSLLTLERLAVSADIRDRAFAASTLALRFHAENRERIAAVRETIRETAGRHHAEIRARLRDRTLEREAFVAHLLEAPPEIRDHLVEEILDIAYPPLEELSPSLDMAYYSPSGLVEILFTMETARLGPETVFVDLGSGLGKVVLLVALLCGVSAWGIELDPRLVSHARTAARALAVDRARFIQGDIRDVPLPPADVYYMFIPSMRSADVAARVAALAGERRLLLFSQALDLTRLPHLGASDAECYWLRMYGSV